MEITGYKLREVLKMKNLELSTLQSQFDENLTYFEGEEKGDPIALANKIEALEKDIAKIQTAQSYYNLHNEVRIPKLGNLTLEEAIKLVGGYGRRSKMFRTVAQGEKTNRYSSGRDTRSKDDLIAQDSITKQQALEEAKNAEGIATKIRTTIAVANNKDIDVEMVDESLLA